MSTRWKLPDLLGGGEYEGQPDYRNGNVRFAIDGTIFWINLSGLSEVKPALPAEPEPGAYLIGETLCMRVSSQPGRCWVYRNDQELFDEDTFVDLWAQVGGPDITPQRLVPEAPEVELPWSVVDRENYAMSVSESQRPWAACRVNTESGVDLTPEAAEDAAAALISAARAARRAEA